MTATMTMDDFLTLVRDETGLAVTDTDTERGLDQVDGWDSLHLLSLLGALEKATGRPVSLPAVLEASSLRQIYQVAVRP
jgi:acyl carrier protein